MILPDGGRNYLSKLYNDEWMRNNGLLADGRRRRPDRASCSRDRHHDQEIPDVVLARTTDRVGAAIDLLQRYGISQLPVSERPDGDGRSTGIVGSVSERSLLERAYRDPAVVERTVGEVMDRPLPTLDVARALDEAFALLSDGAPALLAVARRRPVGVVTKLDLLEYLTPPASRSRLTRSVLAAGSEPRAGGSPRRRVEQQAEDQQPPARRVWMNAAPDEPERPADVRMGRAVGLRLRRRSAGPRSAAAPRAARAAPTGPIQPTRAAPTTIG